MIGPQKVLLDTCTFLWIAEGSPALSERARAAFTDPSHEVYLSAVSSWEIAVKHGLGNLDLPEAPQHWVPRMRESHGITPLPLSEEATLQVGHLPSHHRDPFDRMLVCQAILGGMVLLTPDREIDLYPVRTVW